MWLLSVNRNAVNSNNVGNVNTTGNVNNNNANNSNRFAPDYVGNEENTHAVGMTAANTRAGSQSPARAIGEQRPADGTGPRAMEPDCSGATSLSYAISPEALFESLQKCKRGTLWKSSVSAFWLSGMERCVKLSRELQSGTYQPRPPRRFMLMSPKKRECCSIGIRDRVYQRSLNDNIVYPVMTRSLIKTNAACQKGKGTDFARQQLVIMLKKHWHAHGTDGLALQLDVRGYYPNMRHDKAEAKFAKHLLSDVYSHVEDVLRSQYDTQAKVITLPDGRVVMVGYQAGSQLIQISGICLLDELDHYIKERLKARHYIRYMDDIIILGSDRDELVRMKDAIEEFLNGMGYELNQSKTRITRINRRIPWLGYTFELTDTGKVVIRMKPAKIRQEKRRLRRFVKLVECGRMTRQKADSCFESWVGSTCRICTGNGTERKMRKYYKNLWIGAENDCKQG